MRHAVRLADIHELGGEAATEQFSDEVSRRGRLTEIVVDFADFSPRRDEADLEAAGGLAEADEHRSGMILAKTSAVAKRATTLPHWKPAGG
jgi:hypothetical protein